MSSLPLQNTDMVSYQRPAFPDVAFRDASGAVIDYGRRWHGGSPPEGTYTVSTHPERFAPLHAVAEALIEYLLRQYEASSRVAADLMAGRDDVVRAVRITPANADAAPITFAFTGYPGVVVQAGLLHAFHFPACGCDACDETAEALSDEMEETVMAVTEGRYQETLDAGTNSRRPPGRWAALAAQLEPRSSKPRIVERDAGDRVGYLIVASDGSHRRSGWAALGSSDPADRLAAAKLVLDRLEDGWQPWSLRQA